ncbi:hypothetical protein [Agarivorans gilvus]|uniref:Uncharacterized protein n=1 Tax=Agarivorans gilvus TaxID=680279 RepID=A0ABQ1I6R5_9ALTE|nr:hypothetical protein [Agarivorans gilvus]GGB22149.1 hypothetical protein GCM10007414_39420 [Agarivorans gilvus]
MLIERLSFKKRSRSHPDATGAKGTVRAVIGQNLRQGNVWETAELPALMNHPNVDRIVTIDPVTKIETEIFVRGK